MMPGVGWGVVVALGAAAGWTAAAIGVVRLLHRACCDDPKPSVVRDGIATGRADLQFTHRAEHVHGAWCHPSADGCPERPGM